MGYKRLSNGEWEQPQQGYSRVLVRRAINMAAGGIVALSSLAAIGYGVKEAVESNLAQPGAQTEHDKVATSAMLILFGLAAGIGGGAGVGVRLVRDERSLNQIRQDIADGATVINGKPVVLSRYGANIGANTNSSLSASPQ